MRAEIIHQHRNTHLMLSSDLKIEQYPQPSLHSTWIQIKSKNKIRHIEGDHINREIFAFYPQERKQGPLKRDSHLETKRYSWRMTKICIGGT